jgi:hypothetical protein
MNPEGGRNMIVQEGYVSMVIEKRVPDVYRQHALLDEAVRRFASVGGNLVVGENSDSPDWFFTLHPQAGAVRGAALTSQARMLPRTELVTVIQDLISRML